MERLARTALSTSTTMTTTTTLARVFGSARSQALAPFSLHRSLSTTAMRLAPPRQSGSDAQPAWPPQREAPSTSTTSTSTPASSASPSSSSSDPLKDMYASENPAQWATWSSNDFQSRNGLGNSGADTGLSASSSRSKPGGGTRIMLGPITGRTVHVGGNVDPARAFLYVNVMCTRNRVAADFQKQRFHERPGLKKKRLAMLSWRRKFRTGMQATVKRVKTLSAQGW